MEQRLLADGFAEAAGELRPDKDLTRTEDGRTGHGEVRREFFHFAGIRTAADYFLGALAVYQARRPGRSVPRERVGRGFERRFADQDVHPDSRRRLPGHSPRTGTQLLSASVHESTAAVSRQRE